ncbi:hypothetical protein DB32_004068 [Sandaracinus amylolyticus]|uniref:Uncharacterized protein n=1 Tax=Sandaracinus amylolyticus TaxID=927083 RepID=A0A0F6SFG8_9BACT|nr:hypothetical protein DB32_004068 [Sandaracinus amylolyticus]
MIAHQPSAPVNFARRKGPPSSDRGPGRVAAAEIGSRSRPRTRVRRVDRDPWKAPAARREA